MLEFTFFAVFNQNGNFTARYIQGEVVKFGLVHVSDYELELPVLETWLKLFVLTGEVFRGGKVFLR